MVASFLIALGFFVAARTGHAVPTTTSLLITVGVTTIVWIVVTFLTPPVDEATLEAFYARVRPAGPGWSRIRRRGGLPPSPDSLPMAFVGWILGLAAVYGALFSAGGFVYGRPFQGTVWAVVAVGATVGLLAIGRRLWTSPAGPAPAKS